MGLEYLDQDLFDAPEGSILVHACNAQGIWGSGIAAEFKNRLPETFVKYKSFCVNELITGTGLLIRSKHEKFHVGCLFTSEYFGCYKDSREVVKINTATAINDLCHKIYKYNIQDIDRNEIIVYSNKFNSGLFDVPWEETELILKTILNRHQNIKWIVCDNKERIGK